MKNELVSASIVKRVGSAILDGIIIFLFLILMQSWVVVPISNHSFNLENMQKEYVEKIVDTGLFVKDEAGTVYELRSSALYNYETGKTIIEKDKDKTYTVQEFYEPYFQKFLTTDYANNKVKDNDKDETNDLSFKDTYLKAKQESNLFEKRGDSYFVVDGADKKEVSKFYTDQYALAYTALYTPNNDISNLIVDINTISLTGMIISGTISLVIFTLVIPLCRKDGETLGKMMTGLGVCSRKDGFRVRKIQTVARFFAFFLLEVALSVLIGNIATPLVGLPLVASFTVMVFAKSHVAFHDLCAATFVVDKSRCLIYKDLEAFKEHQEELIQIHDKDAILTAGNEQFEYIDKDNANTFRKDKNVEVIDNEEVELNEASESEEKATSETQELTHEESDSTSK